MITKRILATTAVAKILNEPELYGSIKGEKEC